MTIDAAIAGLIGAVVGAIISLMGTLLAGRQQSQLEHQKWLRAREDKAIKDLQLAVAELARKLAAGVHSMQWFTWTASYQPDKLTMEQLEGKLQAYNQEVHSLFPELTGCLMVIAALNKEVYSRVRPLVDDFIGLDFQIAMAASEREESFLRSILVLASILINDQMQEEIIACHQLSYCMVLQVL